jgi:hypothetical protein
MCDTVAQARKLGQEAGEGAASWIFDGNTPDPAYLTVLAGIEDGDPEAFGTFRTPDFPGECADAYSVQDLARDLGLDPLGDEIEVAADAWVEGASEAFWDAAASHAQQHLAAQVS